MNTVQKEQASEGQEGTVPGCSVFVTTPTEHVYLPSAGTLVPTAVAVVIMVLPLLHANSWWPCK